MERAGFIKRFVAFTIDMLIISGIDKLFNYIYSKTIGVESTVALLSLISLLIVSWIYFVERPKRTNGQTYGKELMKLRIQRIEGKELTRGTLFFREFIGKFVSGVLLFIGYLMALGKKKRTLHDYMSKTIVVKS
jgi:uncharacterized RDD family membrane protein YckC